jgi:succinate dehydrogenase / fumarate reductase cytochrome b subunit
VTRATRAPAAEDRDAASGGTASFVLRWLHSLSGVLPVGVFMLLLLAAHAKALEGPEAHRRALELVSGSLALQLVVLVPLAFHAGYGLWLVRGARLNAGRYPTTANWSYTLQRVTGIVALGFIALYAFLFWLPAQRGSLTAADVYPTLQAQLSSTWAGIPWLALGLVVGVGACCFHLANGLGDFCVRWGLTRSRRGRSAAGLLFGLLGVVLFAVGLRTVVFLATGWRMLGSEHPPAEAVHCGAGGGSADEGAEPPSGTASASPSTGGSP